MKKFVAFSSLLIIPAIMLMIVTYSFGNVDNIYANQSPITDTYQATFVSNNQSIWGPGAAVNVPDTTINLVGPILWDESFQCEWPVPGTCTDMSGSGAVIQVTMIPDPNAPTDIKDDENWSLLLEAETYGQFGMDAVFRFSTGAVDIAYPVLVTVTQSAPSLAGETVIIDAEWALQDGYTFDLIPLGGEIELRATYELYADAFVEGCVDLIGFPPACTSPSFAPFLPISIPLTTSTIISIDANEPISIGFIPGMDGTVSLPDVPENVTVGVDGRSLIAQGIDSDFIDVAADIDSWLTYFTGIPFGFTRPITVSGVKIADLTFNLLDIDTDLTVTQDQTLTLTPTLLISYEFPIPVGYTVWDGATVVETGQTDALTYDADYTLELTLPTDWPDAAALIPTFTLVGSFGNETETIFDTAAQVDALRVDIDFPFPLPSVSVGPVYSQTVPLFTITNTNLFDRDREPWSVPFSQQHELFLPLIDRQ